VLYVGSEDPRKNIRTLLQAFALLREQVGNVRLLMVGRVHAAAERDRLLALVDELGITGSVDFIEDADDDDLLHFYNAANVVVLPSFYEGFGFPAIEAMACGTPAVVSNRSSLLELVDDPTARIDPGDAAALCHAIRTRLNGDARDALLKNAARFTWDRTVQETLQVYEHVRECSRG
jgi:glycosyltransferase involved in cell wall biosynthesis